MDMFVSGLSPGKVSQDKTSELVDLEKARIQQEIAAEKQKVQKEDQEEEAKPKETVVKSFVMSESDMKELLLLMGSRGNPKTIERLVELVKKEKELLAKRRK